MNQMCNKCGKEFKTDFIQPSGKCWECYKIAFSEDVDIEINPNCESCKKLKKKIEELEEELEDLGYEIREAESW